MVCRSDTSDSQMYSMQELSNGELSHSYLCHILAVPLFITWCYEYYWDFSQHQVQSWWREMAGHILQQWCDHDSKTAWYLRLEITYYKVLQLYCFLCKASNPSQDVRVQNKQGPHSYMFCPLGNSNSLYTTERYGSQPRCEFQEPFVVVIVLALFSWRSEVKTQLPQNSWYKD